MDPLVARPVVPAASDRRHSCAVTHGALSMRCHSAVNAVPTVAHLSVVGGLSESKRRVQVYFCQFINWRILNVIEICFGLTVITENCSSTEDF